MLVVDIYWLFKVIVCDNLYVYYFVCSTCACNPMRLSLESINSNLLTYLLTRLFDLVYSRLKSLDALLLYASAADSASEPLCSRDVYVRPSVCPWIRQSVFFSSERMETDHNWSTADPYHADDIEEVTESKVKVGDGHRNCVNSIVSESLKGHEPKFPEEIFPIIRPSII